jgi:hypothetical protein
MVGTKVFLFVGGADADFSASVCSMPVIVGSGGVPAS